MKRGYKETEIGEIPVEWDIVPLNDISKVVKRRNTQQINRSLTISGEHGLIDQMEYFNKKVSAENLSNYYHIKKGEFAYNRSSMKGYPFGAIKRLDRYSDGVLSTLYTCFAIDENHLDSDFTTNLFESGIIDKELSLLTQIGGRAHGLLNITPSQFFSIKLPLPPLPEQKKIAEILSSVDEAIRATQAVIDQTKTLKQGLLNQLLTKGIGHKKFKQTEIGEIPVEWEVKELGDVCDFLNGRAYKKDELLSSGKYKVLRVGNFFSNDNWYYSDLELETNKYCENGDLLYAWSASFGARIWNGEKVIYHYHIWKINTLEAVINKFYLFYVFEWDVEALKEKHGNGMAMTHVGKASIETRKIPLPPLPEQKKIAELLSSIDETIRENTNNLDQLKTTKFGLMQDLLTGKKRVQYAQP